MPDDPQLPSPGEDAPDGVRSDDEAADQARPQRPMDPAAERGPSEPHATSPVEQTQPENLSPEGPPEQPEAPHTAPIRPSGPSGEQGPSEQSEAPPTPEDRPANPADPPGPSEPRSTGPGERGQTQRSATAHARGRADRLAPPQAERAPGSGRRDSDDPLERALDAERDRLEVMAPRSDLWVEAQRRAAPAVGAGDVVTIAPMGSGARRGLRLLAVAAAVVAVVVTAAVVGRDGTVTTERPPAGPTGDPLPSACPTLGPAYDVVPGPADPPVFTSVDDGARLQHLTTVDGVGPIEVLVPAPDTSVLPGPRPEDVRSVIVSGNQAVLVTNGASTVVQGPTGYAAPCDTFAVAVQADGDAALAAVLAVATDLVQADGVINVRPASGDGCAFQVGRPLPVLSEAPDDPIFDVTAQPEPPTVVHAQVGEQQVEVAVPGLVVIDLVGERVEQVALRRGPAEVWLSDDFVQVRWFPGGQERCSSFTVAVRGGGEEADRRLAVELADRITLITDRGFDPQGQDGPQLADGGFALWPETDPAQLPAEEPAWSADPRETALVFAREVLGWDDAVITGAGTTNAGGRVGDRLEVRSASRGGWATVWVHPVVGDRYRVTHVDSQPRDGDNEPYTSVLIAGDRASVDVGPWPEGTEQVRVAFDYAGRTAAVTSPGRVERFELGFEPDSPGAVVVFFLDASGQAIGAWGITLPAGDFAAG